jgi:DNA replication protein DnaC
VLRQNRRPPPKDRRGQSALLTPSIGEFPIFITDRWATFDSASTKTDVPMMMIRCRRGYKSIQNIDTGPLSDFSVITGVNGSGKTHLLEALREGAIQIDGIPTSSIKFFDTHTLKPNVDTDFSPASVDAEKHQTCAFRLIEPVFWNRS